MARRRYSNRGRSGGQSRRRLFWGSAAGQPRAHDTERAYPTDLLSEFQAAYDADLFGFTVTRVLGTVCLWTEESDVETSRWWSGGIRVADSAGVNEADTDPEQLNLTPLTTPTPTGCTPLTCRSGSAQVVPVSHAIPTTSRSIIAASAVSMSSVSRCTSSLASTLLLPTTSRPVLTCTCSASVRSQPPVF